MAFPLLFSMACKWHFQIIPEINQCKEATLQGGFGLWMQKGCVGRGLKFWAEMQRVWV